jgi:hypothetical protein
MTRRSFEAETGLVSGAALGRRMTDGTDEADREGSRLEQEIDVVAKPAVDVLADMEAFQREIDELRERYGKG